MWGIFHSTADVLPDHESGKLLTIDQYYTLA
jgi:hypothetical protein